jgi:O-antigen ligase
MRVASLFGLLGAGLVLAYFFTFYALGVNPVREMNRLDLLIILLCTLFAMGYFRDRRNGGVLHFWEGLAVGVPVVLLSALVSSLIIYAFLKIEPGVFAGYVAGMEKEIRADYAAGRLKDAARFQYYLKALPGITPSGRAFDIFLRNFFICFFATGILAIIMRKHPRPV